MHWDGFWGVLWEIRLDKVPNRTIREIIEVNGKLGDPRRFYKRYLWEGQM